MRSPGAPSDPGAPTLSGSGPTPQRVPAPAPPPGPLADAPPTERLARWDELPPWDLGTLEADPSGGPALRHLQDAEAELTGGVDPFESCPTAEELFAAGNGPGAEPLRPTRALEVRAHLELCPGCAGFVGSLTANPPAPHLLGEPSRAPRRAPARPVRHAMRWVPALAAAVLLVGTIVQLAGGPVSAAWPTHPVVRGEAETGLLFPRGRVLVAETGLDWSASPRFELSPREGASGYRIEVRALTGSAFEAGAPVLSLASDRPVLLWTDGLEPGEYEWEAWATIDGIDDVALGARTFQVIEDAAVRTRLRGASGVGRVQLLHEAGYLTDARREALGLPAGPARDAYLATTPER